MFWVITRLGPHRLTCVMGPSGAGKSTLMNILSGRVSNSVTMKVEGDISFDEVPLTHLELRDRVAYVMQEDCLMPTETPLEAMCFSASLRGVPDAVDRSEKLCQQLGLEVGALISILQLKRCAFAAETSMIHNCSNSTARIT